ncbi:MAG: DUF933 domain-containing protein [Kiritimatiellia bacterium]
MRIAVLGYEQAGKRTLFSLLTGRNAPASMREDEAIEGMAAIRDDRVETLAGIRRPERTRYAEMPCVLCPPVREGGPRHWLEPARRCDLLAVIVRGFTSEAVYHPSGTVDAGRDRRSLSEELILADMELVEKRLQRIEKEKRHGQTDTQKTEQQVLSKCLNALESEKRLEVLELTPSEQASVRSLGFLSLKPVLWIINVDENAVTDALGNPLSISCEIEKEIAEIDDPASRKAFLGDLGISTPGMERVGRAAVRAAGLVTFFTIGEDEVKSWTVTRGASAPEAAGKIHSDMQRGFIRVEVIKFDDLVAAGSESAAKEQGKSSLKGKDYVVEEGDICHFRFNV